MRMLIFGGPSRSGYPGIVFVPDDAMPGACHHCSGRIYNHTCDCRKTTLYFCGDCINWTAVNHTKRIIGHLECRVHTRPVHTRPEPPPPGKPPSRPEGFPKCRFEKLLIDLHPDRPPWLTEKEFMREHGLDCAVLRTLAIGGAVSVIFSRSSTPRSFYGGYEWPFETFYLPGNLVEIRAAAADLATKMAAKRAVEEEARRKRDEKELIARRKKMDEWQKQRRKRDKESLAYRPAISRQVNGLSTGVDPELFGDGCRKVVLPSLEDYDRQARHWGIPADSEDGLLGRLPLIEAVVEDMDMGEDQ